MQTDYNINMTKAVPGLEGDARDKVRESYGAFELLPFGLGLVKGNADDGQVKVPKRNTASVVFSGALVASNVVNGNVNGVAIAPVTYATSSAASLAAVGAAIVATLLASGIVATAAVSSNTVVITAKDANVLFDSFVVTLGGGQATATYTYSSLDAIRGLSVLSVLERTSPTLQGYKVGDAVNVLRRGTAWVTTTVQVAVDEDAYINVAISGKEGQLTNISTGNIGPIGKFRDQVSSTLALVEVNMP